MRVLFLAALIPLIASAQDAAEIVRRALAQEQRNHVIARNYTFLQREQMRLFNMDGKEQRHSVKTYDITLLDGSGYKRLVSRDDKPLPPDEERKQQEELRLSNEARRQESEEARKRRIADWERQRFRQRAEFAELPIAMEFRIEREDRYQGRDVWVLFASPRPGYKAKSENLKIITKANCRFWIDKQDYSWLRAELTMVDTISRGAIFLRVAKGSTFVFEQARVNDEAWMPRRMELNAAGRILLVKGLKLNFVVDFTNFKKFHADSQMTTVGEVR